MAENSTLARPYAKAVFELATSSRKRCHDNTSSARKVMTS